MKALRWIVAALLGALFSVGLALSGMTQPSKVAAFLDVSGAWDPSLALVMVGAIGVYLPLQLLIRRIRKPILADGFSIPQNKSIDGRLLGGAALFGLGWGAIGYCPAPAITSLAVGGVGSLQFVGGMLVGVGAHELWRARAARSARSSRPEGGTEGLAEQSI